MNLREERQGILRIQVRSSEGTQVIARRMKVFYSTVKCLLIKQPSPSFPASLSPCSVWKHVFDFLLCNATIGAWAWIFTFSALCFSGHWLFLEFSMSKGFLAVFWKKKLPGISYFTLAEENKGRKKFFNKFIWKDYGRVSQENLPIFGNVR